MYSTTQKHLSTSIFSNVLLSVTLFNTLPSSSFLPHSPFIIPPSFFLHLISHFHPFSFLLHHPAFLIPPPSSRLPHPFSIIPPSSSLLHHPASLIPPPSSRLSHPSFLIPHLPRNTFLQQEHQEQNLKRTTKPTINKKTLEQHLSNTNFLVQSLEQCN